MGAGAGLVLALLILLLCIFPLGRTLRSEEGRSYCAVTVSGLSLFGPFMSSPKTAVAE